MDWKNANKCGACIGFPSQVRCEILLGVIDLELELHSEHDRTYKSMVKNPGRKALRGKGNGLPRRLFG
jgi:hypothetical protein